MSAFLLSLAAVGAILLLASAGGYAIGMALFPAGPRWRAERIGWGVAAGCAFLAAMVPASLAVGATPGWIPFAVLAALLLLAARFLPLPLPLGEGRGEGEDSRDSQSRRKNSLSLWERARGEGLTSVLLLGSRRWASFALLALLLLGIALYALRALTEPMWSNDYLAIWGFKGKTIFGFAGIPSRLFQWQSLGFSHPEYPLGLPFLYAGTAFLLGRWDDHAMALLFPFLQVATLFVLFGWLRRRGTHGAAPLAAAALLSLLEPLYSGFLTGMAEVPLSFGMLLFGAAFSDALDRTDRGVARRLAVASLLVASTKNEGLFLAVAAALLALIAASRTKRSLRWTAAAAGLLPAAGVVVLHRLLRGSVPLRDFDFGLLTASRFGELPARLAESLRTALVEVVLPAWPGLLCLAVLLTVGRRAPDADRLLLLAGLCLAAYLLLPAFAVPGPAWLARTTLARTAAALAPLVAAAIAGRLRTEQVRPT